MTSTVKTQKLLLGYPICCSDVYAVFIMSRTSIHAQECVLFWQLLLTNINSNLIFPQVVFIHQCFRHRMYNLLQAMLHTVTHCYTHSQEVAVDFRPTFSTSLTNSLVSYVLNNASANAYTHYWATLYISVQYCSFAISTWRLQCQFKVHDYLTFPL